MPFQDLKERDEHLVSLESVCNVWCISLLMAKDFYIKDVIREQNDGLFDVNESIYITVDFIKSSMSASTLNLSPDCVPTPVDAYTSRQAEQEYALCLDRYTHLKGASSLCKQGA